MSFGEDLYRWRKAKGLTQQELAVATGVNVSYISNLERDFSASAKGGKPKPSLGLVDKIAKVLDVNADAMRLAAGYASQNKISDDDIGLFRDLNSLPPGKRKLAKRQVRSIIETLSEQEHDFDYGDFGDEK